MWLGTKTVFNKAVEILSKQVPDYDYTTGIMNHLARLLLAFDGFVV